MASSKRTINHNEIKKWAQERNARPSTVKGTGKRNAAGLLRLNFPDFAETNLQDISWNEFFQKFDESDLALLYQDTKSNGEVSNFSKLVKRNPQEMKEAKSMNKPSQSNQRPAKGVGSIMSEDVVWCIPKSSLEEAAVIMTACDCGEIPVVESDTNPKVIGVITDRDITCRSLGVGKDPLKMTVKDCMTTPAVTVTMDDEIEDCARLMQENQIRRIVVVDEEGICCGIVSQGDLAQKMNKGKAGEVVQGVSRPSDNPSQVSLQ